ncbi:Hypothetical protein A7982_09309 [Minicystis rosea]|nr:Hypothetical protein A7982_09309 [Minicystis rosea]
MTRLAPISALGIVAATLCAGVAAAQPAPGVPAAATGALPPPPPPPPPTVAGAATAIAGVTPEYTNKPDFKAPRKPNGWDTKIAVGGTVSFANNSNVAGQMDGTSFSMGFKLDAGADYNHFDHEWRNTLVLGASITRTPVIPEFVKTNDSLTLESIYLYHIVDWFGPFVRFQLNTAMFPGRDVRSGLSKYKVQLPDGTMASLPQQGTDCTPNPDGTFLPTCRTSLSLSDGFRPLTFKQSIGLFVQPLQSEPITFEARAGLGAQEVIAKNQLALADDATTIGVIELKQLSNANQLGGELALSVWGTLVDKRVIYKANAAALAPFAYPALPPGDNRKAFELTNIQLDATLSFKIVEWASIDYQFKAIRQPQVLDAFQIQNALLLTFGLSYGTKPPEPMPPAPPPPPPPAAPGAAPASGAPAPAAPATPAAPAPAAPAPAPK